MQMGVIYIIEVRYSLQFQQFIYSIEYLAGENDVEQKS